MANWFHALRSRSTILYSGSYLNWLGLSTFAVEKAFAALRIHARSFSPAPLLPQQGSKLMSSPTSADELLRTIALYPVCIAAEKLPYQLQNDDPELKKIEDLWLDTLRAEYNRLTDQVARLRPEAMLLVQGYEPRNAVARLIALQQGIPFLSVENTALIDRMLWDDQSGITTNQNLSRNFFWRYQNTVSQSEVTPYIERLIAETKSKKQGEHASPATAFQRQNNTKRRTVLFLGQVFTDSSIIFGCRSWNDPVNVIANLAQLAQGMDFRLIVKLHPKEISGLATTTALPYNKLTYRKLSASKAFQTAVACGAEVMVDHENEFDTYSLIEQCDAAVTLNSQAGLEAAIRNRPVVVCGDAFYGGLGFTLEAPSPNLLSIQLESALGLNPQERDQQTHLARQFAYIYFEKYCVPKTPEGLAALVKDRCL